MLRKESPIFQCLTGLCYLVKLDIIPSYGQSFIVTLMTEIVKIDHVVYHFNLQHQEAEAAFI